MSVRAKLVRLHSPDAPNLERYSPPDPKCFGVLIQAMYAPEGGDGEESFDVIVCTPSWLERQVAEKGVLEGRHHLIVREFDVAQLRAYFERYGWRCSGRDWRECATKLARLGRWEFEDYAD